METLLKSKKKIRFQDCDPFNHLNNSKYVDYFLNAREDQILKHYQLNVFENMQSTGEAWVVASNQIQYLKPAFTYEEVTITSQLIDFSSHKLMVEMKMYDATESVLKAILWSKFVPYSIRQKIVVDHSRSLMDLFDSVVVRIDQTEFEERCRYLVDNQGN